MKLTFSPVRMDEPLTASVLGDVLTLNGEALDFTSLPAGAILAQADIGNPWVIGDVLREDDGTLVIPLLLPLEADAPPEKLFPEPLMVKDGPVEFVARKAPGPVDEDPPFDVPVQMHPS